MRPQTQLLHLLILHDSLPHTQASQLTSAHAKLSARHADLQASYADALSFARSARQARNLLALHRWTSGNAVTMQRKVAVLGDVLGEVYELTVPEGQDGGGDGGTRMQEEGRFTKLARLFGEWMDWVQGIWAERDRFDGSDSDGDGIGQTAPSGDTDSTFTPIDGLGDSVKAEIRALQNTLERMSARLEDVRNPPIPFLTDVSPINRDMAQQLLPEQQSQADRGPSDGQGAPTPRILADLAWALVSGMKEELQAMREVDFEVVIGEKAWTEGRVRALGGRIGGKMGSHGL